MRFAMVICLLLIAALGHAADTRVVRVGDFNRGVNGSGVIVSKDGYILTAFHVVSEPQNLGVRLADGREFWATGVAFDSATDLALLKIAAHDLVPVRFAAALPGISVTIVGYVGLQEIRKEAHVVAIDGKGFRRSDLVVTDVEPIPGMSGGPMLNDRGEVVGINLMRWMPRDKRLTPTGAGANVEQVQRLLRRSM